MPDDIENWDQPGAQWDSGLQWDINSMPGIGDPTPWLNLIVAPHRNKPKFMAMMRVILQPLADVLANLSKMINVDFDIDQAIGAQLDIIGLWVGRSRKLSVPITGVFFTFDTGPGFDIGIFRGPLDPKTYLASLPDPQYRILLYATIAANNWDGTIEGAYNAYAIIFAPLGFTMLIVDYQDMSMDMILGGPVPDVLTKAIFEGGYLNLKPATVRIRNYITSANANKKIFTFDAPPDSPIIGGFDVAAFANFTPGP